MKTTLSSSSLTVIGECYRAYANILTDGRNSSLVLTARPIKSEPLAFHWNIFSVQFLSILSQISLPFCSFPWFSFFLFTLFSLTFLGRGSPRGSEERRYQTVRDANRAEESAYSGNLLVQCLSSRLILPGGPTWHWGQTPLVVWCMTSFAHSERAATASANVCMSSTVRLLLYRRTCVGRWLKVEGGGIALNGTPSQSYGASPGVWDHTVLPAIQHR